MVIVPGELPLGEMVPVRIDGAMAYDLTGIPVFEGQSPATCDHFSGRYGAEIRSGAST